MTGAFGVRPQDLVEHAGHIEAIGDRVAAAASVPQPGADAYGKLCVMVPLMLGTLQEVVIDGIRAAAESLDDTGARLRTTAASYQATDEGRRRALREIQGSTPWPPPPPTIRRARGRASGSPRTSS